MKIPFWLLALLFLLWTGFVVNYFYNFCECCGNSTAKAIPAGAISKDGTLDYRWNNAETVTGSGFNAYKTGILAKGAMSDTLVITGHYRKDEKNTTAFADLGLARAEAAKKLFLDKVPDARIRCASMLVNDDMNQSDLHTSTEFTWIKGIINTSEASIIESGNETSILFPFGSASKSANAKVDGYLASLCEKHKGTNVKFTITGHTDNVGEPARNKTLGMNRANSIRQILRDCGISRDRITTDSKGQEVPVAENTTDEGRYQNRRVVIAITQ